MRTAIIAISCCLLLTFFTCHVNNWDVYRYQNKFERNKKDFEQLVNLLRTQKPEVGKPINVNELPEEISSLLNDLDIVDVNTNVGCKGSNDFEFTTWWSRKATLYFTKSPCDQVTTAKGFHQSEGMIETWGMGDGWYMWIDYDYI